MSQFSRKLMTRDGFAMRQNMNNLLNNMQKRKRERNQLIIRLCKNSQMMPTLENTFNQENEDFINEKAPRLMK